MLLTSALVSLALAAGALANPVARGQFPKLDNELHPRSNTPGFTATPIPDCMLPSQADKILKAFNYLLANPTAPNFMSTGEALIASNFTSTSDSINQLAGNPEGSVSFTSAAAFLSASRTQPPLLLETLDSFNSCDAISWRWVSYSGTGDDTTKVKGIDNLYINCEGKIQRVYSEFNSGAWINDLGGKCAVPAGATA